MNEDKKIAVIGYLTIIGSVVAIIMNSEKKYSFASFHNRQSLGLFLLFFALGYPIGYFDSWAITMGFYLFFFIFWIYGFMGALQYEQREIPLLGKLFQKLFKSL
jgi:uncharacterized membrane protein